MINAVLAYGATRLGWLSGRFADAVDDAGAYRRIMGCKLDAKPGGDVFNLHGDVGGNLPALPARL